MTLDENLSGEFIEDTGDGRIVVNFLNGKKEGLTRYISASGIVLSEIEFKNDVIDGAVKQFYPSGELLTVMTYVDGKLNGPFTSFYTNGMKQMITNYQNGVMHGKFETFDEFGDIVTECIYDSGKKQGKNVVYYPKSQGGGVYELSFYVDDLLSGDKVTFYPTGEVLSVTPYNKGKAQQYTKNYTKDGKELKIA